MDEQQTPSTPTETPDPDAPPAPSRKGIWIAVVIAVVVIGCLVGAYARGSGGGSGKHEAEVACEGFVKDRLKAPATADFSGENVEVSGSTYTVTGAVDAENSFGAKLRQQFTCVVVDAGDEWRLTSLTGL